jgi:hypothetical protein
MCNVKTDSRSTPRKKTRGCEDTNHAVLILAADRSKLFNFCSLAAFIPKEELLILTDT